MMIDSPLGQSGAAMCYHTPIKTLAELRVGCIPLSHREKKPLLDRKSRHSSPGTVPFSSPFHHSALLLLHRLDTLIDGIEMLHFRSTVALKELFQTQLKRPLTGRVGVNAAPATSVCFSTAGLDGGSPGRGRAFAAWRAPPHFTRRHGVRDFCSKGDGQNDAAQNDAAKDSEK